VLLKFNPAELGNAQFVCIAYPLTSVDDVQSITVPDTCDPPPPPLISPALMSMESGNMSLENDTDSFGNDSIITSRQGLAPIGLTLNDSVSLNDSMWLDNNSSQEQQVTPGNDLEGKKER